MSKFGHTWTYTDDGLACITCGLSIEGQQAPEHVEMTSGEADWRIQCVDTHHPHVCIWLDGDEIMCAVCGAIPHDEDDGALALCLGAEETDGCNGGTVGFVAWWRPLRRGWRTACPLHPGEHGPEHIDDQGRVYVPVES